MTPFSLYRTGIGLLMAAAAAGCAQLPASGPTTANASAPAVTAPEIQVVEITDPVARRVAASRRERSFDDVLSSPRLPAELPIGLGDSLEVTIWEAPPATLFGSGLPDPRLGMSSARGVTMPEQQVDREGQITVPFVGRVVAAGRHPQAIEAEIARRLTGKANQPEVVVRRLRNASATVTVVGEVASSVRLPLTPAGERLLDALAAAGGVRQPVSKVTLQLTRGTSSHAVPLDRVIRDPRLNVSLFPGDVVTALASPLSFTALGATGRNEEIAYEAQGISLAQAIARSGGLQDARADAQGIFVFRFEQPDAVEWPRQPVRPAPDGRVPVVYRIDLRNPASFFVMQSFPISDGDVLYVSNAPAADLQKFLNLVFSVAYPILNVYQVTR
jgi:polysaccharide biosynthesis/export protein